MDFTFHNLIQKSFVLDNCEYIDPLNIFDHFLLGIPDHKKEPLEFKSLCLNPKEVLRDNRFSGFEGRERLVIIDTGEEDLIKQTVLTSFLYSVILVSVDKNMCKASSYLNHVIPLIYKYQNFVSSESFHPELFDLYNLNQALNSIKPDLIIEIGGGVSTVLFSSYTKGHCVKHFLIDPEPKWVNNTFKGLEFCGLPFPKFEELDVVNKRTKDNLTMQKLIGMEQEEYMDFSYKKEWLLDAIANSKTTLVFVDANAPNSSLQGAEFLFDNEVSENLPETCFVLVDGRLKASHALSLNDDYETLYNTNTGLVLNRLNISTGMINYGFSMFKKKSVKA